MKTTIDIPEKEMRDAIRFTKAKTKREAIVKVLEDFARARSRRAPFHLEIRAKNRDRFRDQEFESPSDRLIRFTPLRKM